MSHELSIGEIADLLYQTRQARYAAQKEVDRLQEDETKLKDLIINTLPKGTEGAQGKLARVAVVTKVVPQLKDAEMFFKYVSRTRAWELLQKRVSAKAITERWEAGKTVPGVEPFIAVDVSLNKVEAK